MDIRIYHNPNCGTSRNTLALIRNTGVEPQVIEYLKTPPSRDELKDMIAKAGLTVRQAIREKGTPYAELGLDILPLQQRGPFAKEDGEVVIDRDGRRVSGKPPSP
jgi:arsenate reductase